MVAAPKECLRHSFERLRRSFPASANCGGTAAEHWDLRNRGVWIVPDAIELANKSVVLAVGLHVGRIFETRGQPENLRWFWSLTINGPMMRSGRVASLEEAKAQLQKSWDAWKAWAKLEEVA
jgi:hypothetical protein